MDAEALRVLDRPAAEDGTGPRPILIIGLTHRVGTNFLARVLSAHPECTEPTSLHEDFLISGLPHLERYVREVSRRWNPDWGAHARIPELRRRLGQSIVEFIRTDAGEPGKRPVLKTPTIYGVEHAASFIPQCDIVVLLRNGPDVVESALRSFGRRFEDLSRKWGAAAHHFRATVADGSAAQDDSVVVVRYEELMTDPQQALARIFDRTGLDPAVYDPTTVEELPLFGSSTERGKAGDVHWSPVEKPRDFNPLGRSRHWRRDAFVRFDWLTGGISEEIGYRLPYRYHDGPATRSWQVLRDQKARLPYRLRQRLRYTPDRHETKTGTAGRYSSSSR
ncbi:MAG TPA: sulfotransferase [Alphaproteobacteria bacterium]|jgi:hypothetical protein|nr:sulfotransferase [Alphaproteobacteria bacterium]